MGEIVKITKEIIINKKNYELINAISELKRNFYICKEKCEFGLTFDDFKILKINKVRDRVFIEYTISIDGLGVNVSHSVKLLRMIELFGPFIKLEKAECRLF